MQTPGREKKMLNVRVPTEQDFDWLPSHQASWVAPIDPYSDVALLDFMDRADAFPVQVIHPPR